MRADAAGLPAGGTRRPLAMCPIWQMAAILALTRICVTFELPSRQVFFYELVGPETLPNAIALSSGLFNSTRVHRPGPGGSLPDLPGRDRLLRLERVQLRGGDRRRPVDPPGTPGATHILTPPSRCGRSWAACTT